MIYDIDVHIIVTDGWTSQKEEWFNNCLSSLDKEPVNVHIVEGELGHIGRSRAKGFRQGSAKYVSFVDPDDWVEPGIFEILQNFLDSNSEVSVVSSAEKYHYIEDNVVTISHKPPTPTEVTFENLGLVHHLVLARRNQLEKYLHITEQFECRCEPATWTSMYLDNHKLRLIYDVGYNWRIHSGGSHKAFHPSADTKNHLYSLLEKAREK